MLEAPSPTTPPRSSVAVASPLRPGTAQPSGPPHWCTPAPRRPRRPLAATRAPPDRRPERSPGSPETSGRRPGLRCRGRENCSTTRVSTTPGASPRRSPPRWPEPTTALTPSTWYPPTQATLPPVPSRMHTRAPPASVSPAATTVQPSSSLLLPPPEMLQALEPRTCPALGLRAPQLGRNGR